METLLNTDRCDHCGSQAYVRVINGKYALDFCGHAFNKYADKLESQGWEVIIDTRDLLNRRPVGAEVG